MLVPIVLQFNPDITNCQGAVHYNRVHCIGLVFHKFYYYITGLKNVVHYMGVTLFLGVCYVRVPL